MYNIIDTGLFNKEKDSNESNEDDEKEKELESRSAFESGNEGMDEEKKPPKQRTPTPSKKRKGTEEERISEPTKRNKSQGSGTTDWMRTISSNTRKGMIQKFETRTMIMGGLVSSVENAVKKTINNNSSDSETVKEASYFIATVIVIV